MTQIPSILAAILAVLAPLSVLTAAPTVTTTVPAPGSTVSSLTSVSLTFSEAVTGVEAGDLIVAGDTPATVTGSGAGPYVFSFTQPQPGTVAVTWDVDHGVAGIGTGAFVPAGSWSYTLTDSVAPAVGRITTSVAGQEVDAVFPTPASTVAVLTQATVTFSEAVTGVDAADLLVKGVPASAVTGADAGPYVFTFPQPADGAVAFTWAAGTGIVDTAGNAFAPNTWSVTKAATLGTVKITEFLAANAGGPLNEPALQVPAGSVAAAPAGGTNSFLITANGPWTATTAATWLTLSAPSGTGSTTLTITSAANTGAARTATVTIAGSGVSKLLTVAQAAVGGTVAMTGISVSPTIAAISNVGGTYALSAVLAPTNATNQTITWASNDPNVATVSSQGVVTGVSSTVLAAGETSPGVVGITATAGGFTSACKVTVVAGRRDENWDVSPWIELANTGTTPVDLTGWSLSNDYSGGICNNPDQWVLPARTVGVNGRLVLWASGKNRKPATTGHLHSNFTLETNGGSLGLFKPDSPRGAAAFAYVDYPVQRYDYSYGIQSTDSALRYFFPPTVAQSGYTLPTASNPSPTPLPAVPSGAVNGTSVLTAVTPNPTPSVTRGFFNEPFPLILSCADAAATIRYTLNGSVPGPASTAYTAPLTISGTTVLRMAAYGVNKVPSETITQSYLFLDAVLNQASPPYNLTPGATGGLPQPPVVGGQTLPYAWSTAGNFTTANTLGGVSNLVAGQVPADYGIDPDISNDPNKYNDSGAIDSAGKTNLTRIKQALRELPMLSLVLKIEDMFGTGAAGDKTAGGIYPNSSSADKTDRTKAASLELLNVDGTTGFAVDCGIDNHGNASRDPFKNPKHGFTLRFKGRYGAGKLDAALFPDSPVHQWDKMVLRADFNSSWRHQSGANSLTTANSDSQRPRDIRCRDAWTKDTFRDMGRIAGHHRYTNLFINGVYWGTYDLAEDEAEDFAASYMGGVKDDYDAIDQGVLKSGNWTAYSAMKNLIGWTGGSPTTDRTTAPTAAVFNTAFTNANYESLKQYLDVPWFADYMILHWYTGHLDWATTTDYNKNWYTIRYKTGKFRYLPWDQENLLWHPDENRVTGMTNYAVGGSPTFYPPTAIHPRVKSNAEYRLDCADRAHKHLVAPGGALTPEANTARLDKWTAIMNANEMCLESARWGDYRRKVHSYTSTGPTSDNSQTYTWNVTWRTEVNRLRNDYFPVRTSNLLGQLRTNGLYPTLNAPQFRDSATDALATSFTVPAGWLLKMSLTAPVPSGTTSAGTIWFTTDGNDPRVAYDTTGSRTATAQAYTAPVGINATTTVKARCLSGTTWSALMEQTFTVGAALPRVRITELNYNPKNSQGGTAAEFVEIQNTGTTTVDVGNWSFDGIDFVFPLGYQIGPGDRAVVAGNDGPAVFAAQYPGVQVAGYFSGSLSNGGERVTLYDRAGRLVSTVEYGDAAPWPVGADGGGYSLEVVSPDGDLQNSANWKASTVLKGTPGTANGAVVATVVISEFFAAGGAGHIGGVPAPDFVELQNTSGTSVDAGGWTVAGVSLPLPSLIAPGARLVVQAPLDRHQGDLVLRNAAGATVDGVRYGPQTTHTSFFRNGGGWTLGVPTPGATNVADTPATLAACTINEVLSNPETGEDDWFEIYNKDSDQDVDLTGAVIGRNGELFQITAPTVAPSDGYVRLFCNAGGRRGDVLNFNLSATGGTLTLNYASGVLRDSFTWTAQETGRSQGRYPELNNDQSPGPVVVQPLPNPEFENSAPGAIPALLNEVLVYNESDNAPWAARPSWVELNNPYATPLDLAGWQLRTVATGIPPMVYTFPAGAVIPPGGKLSVWDATPGVVPAPHYAAGLDLLGDYSNPYTHHGLELAGPDGRLVDRVTWGQQVPGKSIGRLSDGTWALLATPTRNAPNSGPALLGAPSVLRVNEWSGTNPAAFTAYGEFFELYNPDPKPVALAGLWLSDEPGEVSRKKFRIPALTFIPAAGYSVWQTRGEIQADYPQGLSALPWTHSFHLASGGEMIRVSQDDAAGTLVDQVGYGSLPVWPLSSGRLPDGSATVGAMTRQTPGFANGAGPLPVFYQGPVNTTVKAGQAFLFEAAADAATGYQWKRNGADIPGATGSTYGAPATLADEGVYTCVATNGSGSTTSAAARLTVLADYAAFAQNYAIGSGGADADGDGLCNLVEFLAGTNPLVPATAADQTALAPSSALDASGGGIAFTLDVTLNNPQAAYYGLKGDISTGLDLWTATTPFATELLPAPPGGGTRVRLRFPLDPGAPREFLRLRLD